ncbi:peptide chain release factor N(5)-glutamine methyltransferase [Nakamurella aerolata]|uniref:Release factor glutamine methyltransferase n=1 Tax=Nakamurella aerolata TaxID=1656892 RepID=A0A849AE18_9ACTN|nr:peptide chain release factor N(5)-glutamine methyltransferase [Nakamurella aerolata]NNG37461.1 peptide chain release factor N(5)-glutamine methyltransferase [Nakamurella aerolata]
MADTTPLRMVVRRATDQLAAAGVPTPKVDAEELAAWLLGVNRTRLYLTPLVSPSWADEYLSYVDRRAQRVPLQHIFGSVPFGGAQIAVGPGVFVPRPETELLLQWGLAAIADVRDPLVVDLCTGSGALALGVAAARPDARVIAVEQQAGALAWARRNNEQQLDAGGAGIDLRGGDVLDARVLGDVEGQVDLALVNPPYVPDGTPVPAEVAEHDPAEAVFAGPDGLALIRPLVSVLATLLHPGAVLALEHDDTQGESVPALFAARKLFADVTDHDDLAGRPRFVTATRVSLRRHTT